jgi:hypothetical protein
LARGGDGAGSLAFSAALSSSAVLVRRESNSTACMVLSRLSLEEPQAPALEPRDFKVQGIDSGLLELEFAEKPLQRAHKSCSVWGGASGTAAEGVVFKYQPPHT